VEQLVDYSVMTGVDILMVFTGKHGSERYWHKIY